MVSDTAKVINNSVMQTQFITVFVALMMFPPLVESSVMPVA
jgi:hypothetical protein